jgi:hypothetical protein
VKLALLLLAAANAWSQQYFPPGVFERGRPELEQFTVNWYSKNLKALGEPSLWELSQADRAAEVYRFLWLRTNGHPVSVRIVLHAGGRPDLFAKVATGRAGYDPGSLKQSRETTLMDAKTRRLLECIEGVKFWTQPLHAPEEANVVTLDGTQWIVEGIKGGEYHIIDRNVLDLKGNDAAYILGKMMMFDLAGLKKSEIY